MRLLHLCFFLFAACAQIQSESDQFLADVEEFEQEIENLKIRLSQYPESGEEDDIRGVRKFPIYSGRYSVKWIVDKGVIHLTLIAVNDQRYPKKLRNIQFDDL